MKTNLTKIKFHGKLGKFLNRDFQVKISSVREGIRAADFLSGRRFTKFFLEDKSNLEGDYRILVNGKEIAAADRRVDTIEKVMNSEAVMKNENIETIDIIPVIKGSEGFIQIFAAIALIVLAVVLAKFTFGLSLLLIAPALGLLATGIMALLAEPPTFEDFKDPGKKAFGQSYLFDGPKSTAGEGNPVPLGYGRLLVGGQGVTATYETLYRDARTHTFTS